MGQAGSQPTTDNHVAKLAAEYSTLSIRYQQLDRRIDRTAEPWRSRLQARAEEVMLRMDAIREEACWRRADGPEAAAFQLMCASLEVSVTLWGQREHRHHVRVLNRVFASVVGYLIAQSGDDFAKLDMSYLMDLKANPFAAFELAGGA